MIDYASNPSVFNRRVYLLKSHSFRGESGEIRTIWHPFATVMAAIEPMSSRERWKVMQAQSEATVRIVIRFVYGVDGRTRVLYKAAEGDRTFQLVGPPINYHDEGNFLELMCKEYPDNEQPR